MASVRQVQVTFDCAEPERVARFWCEVLGYVVPPSPEGFATWDDFDRALPPEHQGSRFACVDPSGVGPRLFFKRVPEGKVVKNFFNSIDKHTPQLVSWNGGGFGPCWTNTPIGPMWNCGM